MSDKNTKENSSNSRKPNALDHAESSIFRWFHVIFWTWINPILTTGYKKQLNEDDLYEVSAKDECYYLLNRLESHWMKNPDLRTEKILIKTFWKNLIYSGLVLFPYIAAKVAQPLLLKEIVLTINNNDRPSYIGYICACGLGLSTVIQAIIHQQYFFRTVRVGSHAKISLSSIIYKRLLSLSTSSLTETTTGQIVNLISNDVGKFEELSISIHQIWAAPLEAIIVFILIWNQIGLPVLFGYGVLLILVPLQLIFSKQFAKNRKNTVEWSDKRIKIINEILVGCQIVKMYQWEEALENVVYNARQNEFKSIRNASRIRAINMGISFAALPLISLALFFGSWLMGQVLSPANIFTALSLLSNLRDPVTVSLPYAIEKLSESRIAAKRINQFMELCQRNQKVKDVNGILGNILMNKASFSWGLSELNDIDLNIQNGSLVGIIGSTGSYKSSLLLAILGEMSLTKGTSHIHGQIAYVSQIPWIFAGSIRENILFCKSFDEEKYAYILEACQLLSDLQTFTAGDMTIIGERGVNLSGGQKARISLARALYTDADIYLFDDPLAAVDHNVAQKIFKACISNESIIKTKTRLLVTHQIQFLTEFDHCILLNNGQIEKQGSPIELLSTDHIAKSYEHQQFHTEETKLRAESVTDPSNKQQQQLDRTSIVKDEISIDGNVNIKIWAKLFTSAYGVIGLIFLIFLMLLAEGIYDATNKWLSIWLSKDFNEQRENHYAYIYLGLVLGTLLISLIRADYFFNVILHGASVLHNRMFKSILYTSLRFYESNPVGRILSRFSKDQQILDELLPTTFYSTVESLIMVLGSIVIVGMANPWVLLILIPIIPVFLWLRRYYLRTSRSLKRLESVTRSPIYALFSSSLNGLITIRAFHVENEFLNLFIEKINANSRASFLFHCTSRWFGIRLDLMTCCLTVFTAILSIVLRHQMETSSIALALSYCISLTGVFQWTIRQSAETENFMTSAERIDEYSHLCSEDSLSQGKIIQPANWPYEGRIQFENYKLKYRPELEHVLKGINLEIIPQNKIGIIGRTGSGKSSIFQGLFRLTEPSTVEGKILIDGIDIHSINLIDLRSILNIIPQSPVLFSNSLRYNLDPFLQYTDEQLWNVLDAVQLKTKFDNLDIQVAEYGSNLSVGECQLICVARAMLKQSKILLIDEATAHVDRKTDEIIQNILREKFRNQTILTIAHRLNTIMDCDQIVIMDKGFIQDYGLPKDLLVKQKDFSEESSF
ncbi:unnamed protein product [Adineta ricciae]|uniref:Uncharacterized protein n=1 Tax=Adineta ricciae TaxID=249248 RepID=A0A815MQA5_ADIRI|nr:unnamed protein product [Adineta ricciae]CAF1419328.1 unnamed protein product [Adineta ricciae]